MYILVVIITNTSFPYWKGLKECLLMGHSCSHICMPQDSVCHKSFSVHSLVVIANVLPFLRINMPIQIMCFILNYFHNVFCLHET
jgi:hypothetical protein